MRSRVVVVVTPRLDHRARFRQAHEHVLVEARATVHAQRRRTSTICMRRTTYGKHERTFTVRFDIHQHHQQLKMTRRSGPQGDFNPTASRR